MTDFFFTRSSEIEASCARLTAMNAPQLPLWRCAGDGEIAVILLATPESPWPGGMIKRAKRPTCVIIGGDMDIGGPDLLVTDWKAARRLRKWCRSAIVHGAGGEPEHYREAVRATRLTGRLALIETTSARAPDWTAFLYPTPTLTIIPRGGPHPLPTERRVRH